MSTITPADLQLSIVDTMSEAPDVTAALARYPQLKEFSAHLGNTPLIPVPGPSDGARILAKYEATNPFGSIKDRAAFALFCWAVAHDDERRGPLKLLDYSGGNFALALAGLGSLTDVPVRLTLPSATPPSLIAKLETLRARVELVDAEEFLYGIIRRAMAIAQDDPSWTFLHQMRNGWNVAIHEFSTGREIVRQLRETVPSHLVTGIGTGGTLAGVGRLLRRQFGDDVALVGVTPRELPYGTGQPPNGLRKSAGGGGIGYGLRQPFVDALTPAPTHHSVSYPEALAAMREFRELTGKAIGASAAANWIVSRHIAGGLDPDKTIVTIFADAGTAEDWVRVEGLES